jgi:hypothetical protein
MDKAPQQNSLQTRMSPKDDMVESGCGCLFFRRRKKVAGPSVASKQVGTDPLPTDTRRTTEENPIQMVTQIQLAEVVTSTLVATIASTSPPTVESTPALEHQIAETICVPVGPVKEKSKPRQTAEQLLKASAMRLEKLVPRDANNYIHESISNRCGGSTDIAEINRGLGAAITDYMNQRAGMIASRGAVKGFVETWFSITYP